LFSALEDNSEGWSDRVGNPERRKNRSEWRRGVVREYEWGKRKEKRCREKIKAFSPVSSPTHPVKLSA